MWREYCQLKFHVKKVIAFASSTIAHLNQKNMGDNFGLRFDDLDGIVVRLEQLAIKYENLLTNEGAIQLLPVDIAPSWFEQFSFPWWQGQRKEPGGRRRHRDDLTPSTTGNVYNYFMMAYQQNDGFGRTL